MSPTDCPQPEVILEALAEKASGAEQADLLSHLEQCHDCQSQPNLAVALAAWQALECLDEQVISDDFELRLLARLQRESEQVSRINRWLQQVDRWFDAFHLPALAVVIALCFWVPMQMDSPPVQAQRWQRPEHSQSLKTHFPIQTEDALTFIIEINRNRS